LYSTKDSDIFITQSPKCLRKAYYIQHLLVADILLFVGGIFSSNFLLTQLYAKNVVDVIITKMIILLDRMFDHDDTNNQWASNGVSEIVSPKIKKSYNLML